MTAMSDMRWIFAVLESESDNVRSEIIFDFKELESEPPY